MNGQRSLSDPCRAALLGQGLGDAAGELAFTHRSWEALRAAVAGAPVLRWTDDTAMARVLARHLCERGEVDPEALGAAFARAYEAEPWRGYGRGPGIVFAQARHTGSYVEAARALYGGQGSLGNGAAMRAAPVGLRFYHDAQALDRNARAQAAVTHAHPVAQDGAAVQARAVAEALRGRGASLDPFAFLAALRGHVTTEAMRTALARLERLLEAEAGVTQAARALGTGVATQEAVPYALWCFLRHPDDWLAAFRAAALHGGDRDTIAAMAGAMAGARLGTAGLPEDWLARLEAREALAELGACLCRAAAGTASERSG